jgi:hypothetical protein
MSLGVEGGELVQHASMEALRADSTLTGINDHGSAVGYGFPAAVGIEAFLWNPRTRTRAFLDSTTGGATIALAINDRGEIVGIADVETPNEHLVIWRIHGNDGRR